MLLLPPVYAALFAWFGRADAALGFRLGAVHAVVVGLALPPLARRGRCAAGGPPPDPGLFGHRCGAFTPVGLLMTYALYGAVLGYVYVLPGR